eukprot:CAMPEP_0197023164 /NCGR_PEP_ID=MMETSP1384-20130603/3948_1 /TAXON_ID=29189 /ORGANISM="Ammonia sp." /LENGTH=438 /DNA_ID=CAMNT_0042451351 /DNA_START=58 /DNA_END=1374 /DNA_ORIENTATION=+
MQYVESLKDDEWIINGNVYNLSKFIKYHPGGSFILNANRRRDCTELFESYHLISSKQDFIQQTLRKHFVRAATVNEPQSPYDWSDPLYLNMKQDLRTSVKQCLRENGIESHKASDRYLLLYAIFLVLSVINLFFYLHGYYVAAVLVGVLGWVSSTEILHSGTHYAIFSDAATNLLFAKTCGFYHCLSSFWIYQHVISHHSYTNIDGKDLDLDWHDRRYLEFDHARNQYIPYWKIVSVFCVLNTSLSPIILACIEWKEGATKKGVDKLRYIHSELRNKCYLDVSLQLAVLFVVFPLLLVYRLGVGKGLLFTILPRFVHGAIYHVFSQISHINRGSFRNQEMKQTKNFMVHQIICSSDYAVKSRLFGILSVGLNCQAMHHVLPNVHPCHYPRLADVFAAFCKKYKIQRVVHETLWDAVIAHYSHVFKMNSKAYIESSKAN